MALEPDTAGNGTFTTSEEIEEVTLATLELASRGNELDSDCEKEMFALDKISIKKNTSASASKAI